MTCSTFQQRTRMLADCPSLLTGRLPSARGWDFWRPKMDDLCNYFIGSPGWIRTSDHSINSRMLYR
jgi:hypothetical protein